MTRTLTLTELEAEGILKRAENVDEIKWVGPVNEVPVPLTEAVNTVRRFAYKSHEKIAAIKAVREVFGRHGFYCSLADAKTFVEIL